MQEEERKKQQRNQCGGWDEAIVLDGFLGGEKLEEEKTREMKKRWRWRGGRRREKGE